MKLICICLLLAIALPGEKPLTDYFRKTQVIFAAKAISMQQAIALIDAKNPATLQYAKESLKQCRVSYKQLAFFLEYFFTSEAHVFNAPPKYEVDEPYIEYEAPVGLQQIESLLYDSAVYTHKTELMAEAEVVASSAADLPSLLYHFSATDGQIIESVKLELIRIMTLYISGYDAPNLKSGIEEAAAAMTAINIIVSPYVNDSIRYSLKRTIEYLQKDKDFDTFNRLEFLTGYALPLQRQLNILQGINTTPALNGNTTLFSKDALNKSAFPGANQTGDTSLGRRLFFEKALSGNGTRSCATCHQPDKYFIDGMARNISLEGGELPRNTPGLLYASYQYSQFWDGRAKSLEEQIVMVMHSKQEMDAVDDTVIHRLKNITMDQVVNSLAAYLRTLAPFNSPFDHYIAGDHSALTPQQQHGFNLFMGKGQCGTCHFAPLFNGLIPPLYNRTEFEVLGTPQTEDLLHPFKDADEGRYSFFRIGFYEGAFKTPTIRNAAVTGPYMHHGAFSSMEQVLAFYDKGGGAGIGLKLTNQTLSASQLHLEESEKKAIIAFMEALTDQ
ncbi:cytochrome c peroxidase [Chitinophaga sp. CF118]|uniref:cytochrome-c peroxidase n=1 Tax=Chitinophaga sp. CF118 TaxID=1884367 RepID=UPI0008EFC3EA|nr:cytochrome c peroxidase [Chitinophaga sp. CF118]SFF00634.1 cytochrome c peroxidase [Chitinophaga sp. CF118]